MPEEQKPVIETVKTEKTVVAGSQTHTMSGSRKAKGSPLTQVLAVFLPNRSISKQAFWILIVVQVVLALLLWVNSPYTALPKPMEVFDALGKLWAKEGLAQELFVSFKVNLIALLLSTLISLGLSYLTVMPFFRPIVAAISKGRFLTLVGFSLIFTIIFSTGSAVKMALLTFGMTVFYVTSMAAVIASIPKGDFDHARTLRMKEWRVVWEVVILGTVDKAFEVMRQNAAIGWMMLTMVEGISRSEGGVGVMLLNEQKHFLLAQVYAIQLVILIVGLTQDYLIGLLRSIFCPYADLTLERK